MSVLQKQQRLIQQISAITDEGILTMLEDELTLCLQSQKDLTDDLTPYEQQELKLLSEDSSDENTVSLDEFMKITEQWRTR